MLNINDASMLLQYVLDKNIAEISNELFTKCDVDGDNRLTAKDVAFIVNKTLDGSFKFIRENENTENSTEEE